MDIYNPNKVLDLTLREIGKGESRTDKRANTYYKYGNRIISILLSKDDIVSMATATRVLYSSNIIYQNLTRNMSEVSAKRMIQLIMNLAMVVYQWILPLTSTWIVYFLTTSSGLKKIYECIFVNPLYGFIFYLSFYFKILGNIDKSTFNHLAHRFNLPRHVDLYSPKVISAIVDRLPTILFVPLNLRGSRLNKHYKKILNGTINSYWTQIAISSAASGAVQYGASRLLLPKVLHNTTPILNTIPSKDLPVYISSRNSFDFDDTDIQNQLQFLKNNKTNIKKYIQRHFKTKKHKKHYKRRFRELAEIKTPEGRTICLDKCTRRVKTKMGCYCQSKCGATTFLGDKKWCWVDFEKCEKGRYLDKFLGYPYDYCNPQNVSETNKCFTGVKYKNCITL